MAPLGFFCRLFGILGNITGMAAHFLNGLIDLG